MPTANVNIVAVLVAALLTFVLGAFWYSPVLFARQWMQAQGYTQEKVEEMKKKGMTRAYAVSVLCYIVTAYVVRCSRGTLTRRLWRKACGSGSSRGWGSRPRSDSRPTCSRRSPSPHG